MKDEMAKEIHFPSADGVNQVTGWIYMPEGQPKGIVQICHGMCEYIGRYQKFIGNLTQAGFVAAGHDHIGHGASSAPEKYGYFGEKDGYRNLVEDLHTMTKLVKSENPNLPCFLFGHSMGSFVSRLYLSKYSDDIDGVILCGTGGPNPMARIGASICQCVADIKGPFHRSGTLDKIAFGSFNKKCVPQRTEKDWLTRADDVVDTYLQDPKCMFLFTACGYRDLSKMSTLANSAAWYRSLDKKLPVYLIAGDMDPVGNYGKGVQKVFCNMQSTGMQNVSIKLYPGARHELLNEINYCEVYADILEWLSKHLPESAQ